MRWVTRFKALDSTLAESTMTSARLASRPIIQRGVSLPSSVWFIEYQIHTRLLEEASCASLRSTEKKSEYDGEGKMMRELE